MRTARNRHRCPLARKAMVDTPTTGKAPTMNPTRSTSPGTVRRWSAAAIAAVAVTLGASASPMRPRRPRQSPPP